MSIKNNLWTIGIIAAILGSCNSTSNNSKESANLIIYGAKIFTSNTEQPWASAVAVKDGKFIYVGDSAGASIYQTDSTRVINLEGKLVIAGLTDAHSHPGYGGVEHFGEVEGETKEELLASVKAYADNHPDDEWLRLCCWPTAMFATGTEGPQKEVLDAVVPDRLIWFESSTAHDFWLNSKALEKIGVNKDTPDPRPGMAIYARDKNGELTGWIKEGAGVQHFVNQFNLTEEERLKSHQEQVESTLKILSEFGVTTLFDAGNKGYGDLVYSLISKLEKEGKLPIRYEGTYQVFTPKRLQNAISEVKRYRKEYGGTLLQFNTVKIFMDGINENHSVGLLKPYANDTNYIGNTLLTSEELRDFLLELSKEKLDLHVHTIGDLTVRTVIDAVEAAKAIAKDDFYPRITMAHLELIDPTDLPRIKELGIICNFTPWWLGVNHHDVVEESLGEERYSNMYKAKSLFNLGATVTFSSDEWWGGDMLRTYINPYFGMQVGHNRQYPKDWWETDDDGIRSPSDERLTLEQLVTGYTKNGAYQLRKENILGSIETGKLADFVVLDKNLFEVDKYEIKNVMPSAVVMDGKVIRGNLP
ncbi:MAG: amidohydrolase [Flavobacteriales bacterium]|nr:amidohydrolase [Flavobacteriales bacterium]